MPTERTLIPVARTGVAATLAVAVVAALAAAVFVGSWRALVTLPLPYRRMEIPIVWWAVYAGYVVSVCRLLRVDAARYRTLWLDGLLLHLQWLLVAFLATAPLAEFLGRAYRGYVALIVFLVVTGTSYLAGRLGRELWAGGGQGGAVLARFPLCVGTALIVGFAAQRRVWLVVGAAALGTVLGWWSGRLRLRDRLEVALGRLRDLVQARRAEWIAVAAVALIGVALRLAWYRHLVATVGMDFATGFFAASDDGQFYHTAASAIAADPSVLLSRANPVVSSSFDPLYPLLLGFWYRLAGVHVFPAVLVQCLLGGLTVVLIYQIGRELAGGRRLIGLIAALLTAISQPLIFSSAVYGIEALYVPALACWIWAAVRYAKPAPGRWRWVGVLGLCGGLLLGLRRFAPLFLLALLPWMVWAKRDVPVRARVLHWFAATGVALLVYAPVEAMYAVNGQARLLSRGGAMYWEAPAKFPDLVPDNSRLIALGIDPFRDPVGSLARAAAQPVEVARAVWATLPKRVSAFFFWAPFGHFNTVTLLNPTIPNAFTPAAEFYLALAVLVGAWWTVRRPESRAVGVLLLLAIVVQAFVHSVLFFTHSIRYSIPVRPYLALFAAAAAAPIVRAVFTKGFSTHGLGGHSGLQQSR